MRRKNAMDYHRTFFTMLVHLLGPAKNVRGRGVKIKDFRTILTGPRKNEKINVETPTSYVASIEFCNGAIIQFLLLIQKLI